jgi:hypothetical protein
MKKFAMCGLVLSVFMAAIVGAQEPPMMPKPVKEHEWLTQFVGEWEIESECLLEPGKPPVKCQGTEAVLSLGGFWIVSELKSTMMGQNIDARMTVGYDPAKKKYVGSWVDSCTSHMWKYEGTVDASGKILTLEAEGPNMMNPGKMAKYKDVTEFKSKDHRVLTSSMQGEDGKWTTFVTMNARRKK